MAGTDNRLVGCETPILVGAAIAGGLGAVVWLGAALAAIVHGEQLDGGFGDAIHAGVRLPQTLADPREAWPQTADRAALPGPFLYWLSTALVATALAGLAVLGVRVWRASRERGRVRLGVETRARFATIRDLAPMVVAKPVPSRRFVLGRVYGRLVATEDRTAAPTSRRRSAVRRGDRGSVAVIGPWAIFS